MSNNDAEGVEGVEEVQTEVSGQSGEDEPTTQSMTINLIHIVVQDQGHLQSIMHAIGVTTLRQNRNDVFNFDELKEGVSYSPGAAKLRFKKKKRRLSGVRATRANKKQTCQINQVRGPLAER